MYASRERSFAYAPQTQNITPAFWYPLPHRPRQFTKLAIPPELANRVYYEVHPLQGKHSQTITMFGDGDTAFDYAINLAQQNVVLILNRGSATN